MTFIRCKGVLMFGMRTWICQKIPGANTCSRSQDVMAAVGSRQHVGQRGQVGLFGGCCVTGLDLLCGCSNDSIPTDGLDLAVAGPQAKQSKQGSLLY